MRVVYEHNRTLKQVIKITCIKILKSLINIVYKRTIDKELFKSIRSLTSSSVTVAYIL